MATATFWMCNFLKSVNFLSSMETDPGKQNTFIMLATFSALAYAFVFFFVPETGGKDIEENIFEIIHEDTLLDPYVKTQAHNMETQGKEDEKD